MATNRLRAFRLRKLKCSITALAKQTGLPHSTISMIERGERQNPSWEIVQRLSATVGEPPDVLFPPDLVRLGKGHPSHRGAYSTEWNIWQGMKRRCYNQKDPGYRYYGAKGVRVCDAWRNSFATFLKDMGRRPSGYTLDRIDPTGSYEPDNCRWATRLQQARNKRPKPAA